MQTIVTNDFLNMCSFINYLIQFLKTVNLKIYIIFNYISIAFFYSCNFKRQFIINYIINHFLILFVLRFFCEMVLKKTRKMTISIQSKSIVTHELEVDSYESNQSFLSFFLIFKKL